MRRLVIFAGMALVSSGCTAEATNREWATIDFGNPVLDQFLTDVRDGKEHSVSKVVTFQNISRWYPQYKTASEYFAFIDDCALVSVSVAEHNPDVFWANWSCSDGQFRQAFNTAYEAPKIMASEILIPGRDQRREKKIG